MKTLHILRNISDNFVEEVIEKRSGIDEELGVLLLHDAVLSRFDPENVKMYACIEDVTARGIESSLELLNYNQIVELMFEYDQVICW